VHKLLAALLLIVTTTGSAWADATRVTIGVLVGDGEHNAPERWPPTADFLTREIPEHQFVITPLDRESLRQAVRRNELDFILTNPGQYVELATTYGIAGLATIQHAWLGKSYAMFGTTIITRADRKDIAWLSQIKGKSFMAVSRNDFDGFQLAWWELKAHDIDPFEDFSALIFSGLPPEEIVYAVYNRSVDAATVRAGVLERMAKKGKIDLKEFRILHPHVTPEYPFARSTELYPDWSFAKAKGTPDELAQRVANALLTMQANHPAARAGGYAGWVAPLDYQPVHELLRDLRLSPYEDADKIIIADIVHQYRYWLVAGIAFLLLLIGFAAYMSRLNYRLRLSKHSLESEIAERERAEETLRCSESALRGLHDITSRHNLPFEEKVQALLALGCEQFGISVGILSRVEGENYEIVEVVPADGPIPKGCVFPLGQTYCCITLQSSEPVSFEHAAASEWRRHPAYLQHKLEAYLGIRVEIEAGVYGTLNFISPEPRTVLFTSSDKEVLKLMAQWVGAEIGRQHIGAQMRKLSSALEQTADAVMIVNRRSVIEYVNPAFERITGYPSEEVIGKTPKVLRSGQHGEEFYRRVWKTLLRGEAFHDTFVNRRRDGLLYYEEKTITPLKDEQGVVTHFISTGKDVTKRKMAEERVRQRQTQMAHVQRVSAMGAMATSLAHELNQPLAAIVNYAQGCIHRLRNGATNMDELLTALGHIASEGNRSGEIIRRVREYLRKGKPLRTRSDINHIVREAVELASPEARQKDIALHLELTEGLPPVLADAVQIEQVVLNLVHNAIEAIDGAQSPRREVTVQTHPDPKNGVEVIVRDTGPGLLVRNSDRLFKPFFTTKSSGMGMGLSISHSIIEAHGDQLRVKANMSGGAVFHFALPAIEGDRLQ
jgi:PAS domain S-box-containing protein